MNPLITIIIPTYNRAFLLGETLDSVVAQTYENWECLIVDDFSEDDTKEVALFYCDKDNRFSFLQKSENQIKGANASRNIGLDFALGEYVQFLDSDDIIASNKLCSQLQLLESQNGYLNLITCKWSFFKTIETFNTFFISRNDYLNFDNIHDYFNLIGKHGGFFPSHSFLIPMALIKKAGYWNENLLKNQDGEFFFRIMINTKKILFDYDTFVLYRQGFGKSENLSVIDNIEKAHSWIISWKLIEANYFCRFPNDNQALFLKKKKGDVYNYLKLNYPSLIKQNRYFFIEQIKNDNILTRLKKIFFKIINKIFQNAHRL